MKFVCISDTHMMHDRVPIPDGDVLIHQDDEAYKTVNPPIMFDYSVEACVRR